VAFLRPEEELSSFPADAAIGGDQSRPGSIQAPMTRSVHEADNMMFETRLLREYECCRDALRLSNTQLSSIAVHGSRSSSPNPRESSSS
jgi:hypothetical protein